MKLSEVRGNIKDSELRLSRDFQKNLEQTARQLNAEQTHFKNQLLASQDLSAPARPQRDRETADGLHVVHVSSPADSILQSREPAIAPYVRARSIKESERQNRDLDDDAEADEAVISMSARDSEAMTMPKDGRSSVAEHVLHQDMPAPEDIGDMEIGGESGRRHKESELIMVDRERQEISQNKLSKPSSLNNNMGLTSSSHENVNNDQIIKGLLEASVF